MAAIDKEAVATPAGGAPFATNVEIGDKCLLIDEPVEVGGGGDGPTPYQMLSAALAACTSMTLRLYARGKAWTLPDFEVSVVHSVVPGSPPRDRFDRRIIFKAPVAAERLARLMDIADHCPVHRTLARTSDVISSAENVAVLPEPLDAHFRQMEQACASG